MAQQEGGWPLGLLQPFNMRIGLIRNINYSGSRSFSSFITGSPSSSFATLSDLDTESSRSFFHDRSITLGNIIGITGSILELTDNNSFRSSGQQEGNLAATKKKKKKKSHKSKAWFSLCNKTHLSGEMMAKTAPSLRYFLEVERMASNAQTTTTTTTTTGNVVSITYELNGMPEIQSVIEPAGTLFSNGVVAPPPRYDNDDEKRSLILVGDGKRSKPLFAFNNGSWGLEDKHCFALMFPCMGAQVQTWQ